MSNFTDMVEQEKIKWRINSIKQIRMDLQSSGKEYNDVLMKIQNFIDSSFIPSSVYFSFKNLLLKDKIE